MGSCFHAQEVYQSARNERVKHETRCRFSSRVKIRNLNYSPQNVIRFRGERQRWQPNACLINQSAFSGWISWQKVRFRIRNIFIFIQTSPTKVLSRVEKLKNFKKWDGVKLELILANLIYFSALTSPYSITEERKRGRILWRRTRRSDIFGSWDDILVVIASHFSSSSLCHDAQIKIIIS